MNRGNTRAEIFVDDKDRKKFYEILGNMEERFGVDIYVLVLMKNHYPLLLETSLPNLSRAIQSLNGSYALYFNNRHNRPGHLFQGRFKAMLVEKERYLLELSRYIHLNPVRAGRVKAPKSFKWSSLPIYLGVEGELPFTLEWQWILSIFGRRKTEAMRSYNEFLKEGISNIKNPAEETIGGWILGRDSWVKRIVAKWIDNPSVELSGIKTLRSIIPIAMMERVCYSEFNVKESELSDVSYNNLARIVMIYLAVNHCGFTIREALERYGGSNYYVIAKAISRIKKRIEKDKKLMGRVNHILSSVKMCHPNLRNFRSDSIVASLSDLLNRQQQPAGC